MGEFIDTPLFNDANLQLYHRLEGNSLDETAYDHDGTDTNVDYSASYGKYGQGARFQGTGKIVLANANANLPSGTGDRSFAAWVYPTQAWSYNVVFAYGTATTGNGWQWGFFENQLKLTVGKYGGNANALSSTALTLNDWNHIGVKLVGSTITYYLNGQPDGTATLSGVNTSLQYARIGKAIPGWDGEDGGYLWRGYIDELVAFNRALTDAEFESIFTGAIPVVGPFPTHFRV